MHKGPMMGAAVVLMALGAGAANEINPLYAGWAGQKKDASVVFDRVEQMNGGAPVPGQGVPTTSTVTYTLTELTAERATLKLTGRGEQTLVIPATLAADGPKEAGKEDLKVGTKTYACTIYKYETKDKGELGRDGQGMAGQVTVWACPDVPGGIVRRQISLTIRVSYEYVDTIAVK